MNFSLIITNLQQSHHEKQAFFTCNYEGRTDCNNLVIGSWLPEEDVGGERGEASGQHALRERLKEHSEGDHGKSQFCPPKRRYTVYRDGR